MRLEDAPFDAIYRAGIGFLFLPLASVIFGVTPSGWSLVLSFVATLAALRVVPMVLRVVLRFPAPVMERWKERRHLAKRFDSYQWQKLFWIGLGLAAYVLLLSDRSPDLLVLTAVCLVAGTMGLAVWRRRRVEASK